MRRVFAASGRGAGKGFAAYTLFSGANAETRAAVIPSSAARRRALSCEAAAKAVSSASRSMASST